MDDAKEVCPTTTQKLLQEGAILVDVRERDEIEALSFPEMVILRKVLKIRLIMTFVGVVAFGIVLVGYVFNLLL